jgi:hypothetical protein
VFAPLSPIGIGLALKRAGPFSFTIVVSIYPATRVLHHDQEAGCVEQPRHIRLL